RARGSGDDDHAVRALDRLLDLLETASVEAQLREVELERALVEDAQHDALAKERRDDRDAEVDLARGFAELDAAVLRQPALGDVEVGHDLQPRHDRRLELLG